MKFLKIANMPTVFDKKGEDIEKIKKEHEDEKEVLVKKTGELSMGVKSGKGFSNEKKKNLTEFIAQPFLSSSVNF